ncbi:signal transduction histidine kinase/CheY-like chemotaxis protein [Hydrogenophaga palleronii]|uniref:histidine kinase n=1 Tax=Hydrogenophaga palleronii TaxID=65655 RepID=A0ABU1WHC0_9BURK|nr:ATP-binding protein [Hydrogenophaga palleronii]MDR7148471.1 signal transduction histidine kinase/CheY-like chemotaxis protein [Hydrogenophaga palleronii]
MKLQHKAWVLILLVVALCAGGAMLGARFIVSESFERLEADRAATEGERARRVLDQQVQALSATVRDYAFWVDAVAYVLGQKPEFMDDNFDTENLGYLGISEVLVLDARGNTVSTVARVGGDELGEIAADRVGALRDLMMPVLAAGDVKAFLKTLRVVDGQLEVVVGAAVHRPDDESPVAVGAIVMVRRFDETAVESLSNVLMMPARLSLTAPDHAGQLSHLEPGNDDHDELHAVLVDQQGLPVAELVLSLDRRLHQQAETVAWTAMGLAALAGLLASVLLVTLLDRMLLRRVQGLHDDLKRITEGDLTGSVSVRPLGKDELSHLARGINQLLDRVRRDAVAQREAHAQQEALQMQLLQSQKIEALGRFTGGIAHDFNNSLAAISGWTKMAVEDLDSAHPSHEALQHALKATRYADGLMRQLLAYSRQSPPRMERVRLSSLIEEVRTLVASGLIRRSQLDIHLLTEDDWVQADPTQMQQVLVNLLMNASDAMQGEGTIHLTLDAFDLQAGAPIANQPETAGLPAGRYVCLRVRDEGPGIPPEHLHRVFDPFFTTKKVGRGTGLGLSVVHGIMSRHGGEIGVASPPGEGACMTLYLPAAEEARTGTPVQHQSPPMQKSRHLLFVDDDQLVRHAWSRLLERQGWQVTRARDGEEGWKLFTQSQTRWDVVLTDLTMPRLNGLGLASRIRATRSPPPIVLMSGNIGTEERLELLRTSFAAVLHKPVDAAELESVLREVTQDRATVVD